MRILAATLALAVLSTPTHGCAQDADTDYFGNDIGSVARANAGDCCADCSARADCVGYVWANGVCWLKNKLAARSYKAGATAGYKASSCSAIEENTDYSGFDVASTKRADASLCCDDCTANPKCSVFVWSAYQGGTCWLKSQKGPRVASTGARASSRTTSGQCGAMEDNTDYWGNDVASTTRASADQCCDDCAANSQCSVFVWYGGTCYLKSQKGGRSTLAGAKAGSVGSQCTPIEANTDYFGNDIASTSRANAGDCCADCVANPNCVVAVWYQGTCWLKNAKGASSSSNGAYAVTVRGRTSPSPPPYTKPPPPMQNVQAQFAYPKSWKAGTYDMVTSLQGCQKRSVYSQGTIAPYHEEVSMSFRGPMDIYDISVFQSTGAKWVRSSKYSAASGVSNNLAFMTNSNPDKFNGGSPQGYAAADGVGFSPNPVQFGGWLRDASNPSDVYGGPGVATGAEVNIMQASRCTADSCLGYFPPTYGLHGWGGSKIFVTKVRFGAGGIPAIWILNAQVLRSNQYGCNCRGRADPGGCGELDVAEAIYAGTNTIATHNYFLNANPSPGHDTWTTRPTNGAATFVTILDEASGSIKILKFGDSDYKYFDTDELSNDNVAKLVA
ncbi:hypothetical protein DYB32_008597 [Aphanomyces invadans]|uniref:glucan endo-1,3-beta-D-glucosidase n=1 Tax=Aphanomyces invadans TaxID=157072 RepID=A0A3R7A440_9STRA|nr:hypothetical protein DYB32_008597 [Aphanomyces invadans]